MKVHRYNHGKFFGPSPAFTGYALIAGGLIALAFSVISIFLIIPGAFLAFTYSGTILDTDKRKIKNYTSLFGIIRTGEWIDLNKFTRFNIIRVTNKYTSYSRGNVRLDMDISDIRLQLINRDGSLKVLINKYNKFEEARNAMEELGGIVFPDSEKSEYLHPIMTPQ
jgi:hypothetical protein